MDEASIIIQPSPDPNIRLFHCRFEMTEAMAEVGTRGDFESLSELGRLFLNIRGVECVRLQTYTLTLSKNVAFSWDEITEKVVDIMKELGRAYISLTNAEKNPPERENDSCRANQQSQKTHRMPKNTEPDSGDVSKPRKRSGSQPKS